MALFWENSKEVPFTKNNFLHGRFIRNERASDPDFDYFLDADFPDHLTIHQDVVDSAIHGDLEAIYQLGKIHLIVPEEFDDDEDVAAMYLLKAATAGDPRAQFAYAEFLASAYDPDDEDSSDPDLIVAWLKKAGESGNIHAQVLLGDIFSNRTIHDLDLSDDSQEASYWFRKAALQGIAEAQFQYALLLLNCGEGEDPVEAAYWLLHAALASHELALDEFKECLEWLEPNADEDGFSSHILGLAYYHGIGVGRDALRAEELFREAIELGYSETLASLAQLYWKGDVDGIVQKQDEAIELMRQAVERSVPGTDEVLLTMRRVES
ncbi:MAG: tetratricopeptide repeat protein [Chthoniobacterales bacterium]|nr:tetratricopeptide repeat protein [Chthoniobacterales bacterium]